MPPRIIGRPHGGHNAASTAARLPKPESAEAHLTLTRAFFRSRATAQENERRTGWFSSRPAAFSPVNHHDAKGVETLPCTHPSSFALVPGPVTGSRSQPA